MRGRASFLKGTRTEALHSEGREKGGFNSSNHQNPSASPMAPPAGFLLANEALPSQRATGSGGGFLRPGFRRRGKRFALGGQKRQRHCPMTLNSRRGSASAVLQLSRQGRLTPGERLFPTKRFVAPSRLKMSWRRPSRREAKAEALRRPNGWREALRFCPGPAFLRSGTTTGEARHLSRAKRFPPKERQNRSALFERPSGRGSAPIWKAQNWKRFGLSRWSSPERSASVGKTRKRGKGFKAGSASLGAVEIFSSPV